MNELNEGNTLVQKDDQSDGYREILRQSYEQIEMNMKPFAVVLGHFVIQRMIKGTGLKDLQYVNIPDYRLLVIKESFISSNQGVVVVLSHVQCVNSPMVWLTPDHNGIEVRSKTIKKPAK